MFYILLLLLIVGIVILVIQRFKAPKNIGLLKLGGVLYLGSIFLIPFFDPLQIPGYLAAIVLENSFPSIYATFAIFVVANCGIYGAHIFLTTMYLKTAERYRNKLINYGQYSKVRHPIFASYHIVGAAYFVVMGSIVGMIVLSASMAFLYFESKRIEKLVLVPRYGDIYQGYKENVPRRMYSLVILSVLIIIYGVFVIGLIGAVFFSEL